MLYLIDHPAFDSPNNCFGALTDPAQLPIMTARVLAGLPVKGYRFLPNTAWFEWARDNGCLPTEEEKLEEVQDTMVTKDELDQEGGEAIDASASIAASEDKVSQATYRVKDTR